jgi:hypothetical protein
MVKEAGVKGRSWGRWLRLCLLIAGILLPQVWVFGGALVGRTVLLPLDSLVAYYPGLYWESTPGEREAVGPPRWPNLGDHLLQHEPYRRFAVGEIHAGRLPAWNPAGYGGAPFIANGQSAVFSPYRLIEYLSMDPVVLAWSQLAKALVAGLGMYCFLRWGLRLTWGAAAAGAWFYPWTGFLTVWYGMPVGIGATWMGWVLLATEMTVRGEGRRWPLLLGVFLCFTVFAGHPQIAGHMFLISGVYAVWRAGQDYWKRREAGEVARRFGACVLGWMLGVGLAAVQLLPMVMYALSSERGAMRMSGVQERPAQGWWALMQAVQPWIAGEISPSSVYLLEGNRQESGAAGYAGLLVLLVLAPLAWRLKRWRGQGWFWACVAVVGMSAVAGIPVLEWVTRVWPLGVLSSNRLTCLTAFAVVVLGAMGVNAVTRAGVGFERSGKGWMVWLGVILAVVGVLSVQMGEVRERLAPVAAYLTEGAPQRDREAVTLVLEEWFKGQFTVAIWLAVAAGVFYVALARPGAGVSMRVRRMIVGVVVVLAVGEMVYMAGPGIPQVERKWYPDAPELVERLKGDLEGGRVVGVDTFEPNVGMWWGVESATGYDALDPVDVTALMLSATDKPGGKNYAKLLNFEPSGRMGVLKAMNVKYLVTGEAREGWGEGVMSAEKFYVYEVPGAMGRAYVPRRVKGVEHEGMVLVEMNKKGFDPGELGLVWPNVMRMEFDGVVGKAVARTMTATRVAVAVEMETPGVVVLADAYAPGWEATYNGAPVEILRVNYALRGVVVPAGTGVVEFVYRPWDLRCGFYVTCGAVVVMVGVWLKGMREE